ncbi:helix-turn-helix transcriptional regulator [Streptomyces sp. NBC_01410]|uniref:winged helix-turn-helix transcriptional regulator n=1 Tax=Streptomyces sp. NBC_01410 TaxID=2903856 RepID=UPI00325238E0
MTTDCQTGQHAHHDVYAAQCPCRAMLDLLANKWSALAIGALEGGPQRFGALQRLLQGVSPKVLTQTLRRLEDTGLVDRTIYPAVPLHVEYALTDLGHGAAVPLRLLRTWVEENLDNSTRVPGSSGSPALPKLPRSDT